MICLPLLLRFFSCCFRCFGHRPLDIVSCSYANQTWCAFPSLFFVCLCIARIESTESADCSHWPLRVDDWMVCGSPSFLRGTVSKLRPKAGRWHRRGYGLCPMGHPICPGHTWSNCFRILPFGSCTRKGSKY
uniref:Predicted protein n=1 Tax=Hordeum vulgare subsp. vulgare TaxID=112509 RepID=F2D9N0_HORVV|nr:predicted protein [Hordeum vulgare subsp. vulgare]